MPGSVTTNAFCPPNRFPLSPTCSAAPMPVMTVGGIVNEDTPEFEKFIALLLWL
jgi:hypothetical protein